MKPSDVIFPCFLTLFLCLTSCDGEDGLDGVKGDPGTIGETGATGVNCWDLNGDGINDAEEDINQDGDFNALDCQGADGTDGTNGTNGEDGANGIDGEDGANGTDGTDGVGLEDMLKFGFISVNLEGTRPDGVAFTNDEIFRYTPVDGDDIDTYNSVVPNIMGPDTEYQFELRRFLSTPDEVYQVAYLDISISITNPGEPSEVFNQATIQINNYAVIGNDNKYFVIDNIFDHDGLGVSDFTITEVSFNTATNNLIFNYSFTIAAANNDSENELSVSGSVDVFVLEEVN